jgi:hypothetical protein
MSNLYIWVMTGFYTHRKTARLRSFIGDAAFWVPPRLWAYCAENQPDGDLSGYGDTELEMLIGFTSNATSNATSIKQALIQSGYVDLDSKVHDWEEHNGYHKTFSDRAKAAAAARWAKVTAAKSAKSAKEKSPTPPKEETGNGNRKGESGDKHCLTDASSMNGHQKPKLSPTERIGNEKALKRLEVRVSEIKGQFPLSKTDPLRTEYRELQEEKARLLDLLGLKV